LGNGASKNHLKKANAFYIVCFTNRQEWMCS